MKLADTLLLILLAAIWGSSFIFMRATAEVFGPIALITVRIVVAASCLLLFLLAPKQRREFIENWRNLAWVGIISSAVPFCFLAYAVLQQHWFNGYRAIQSLQGKAQVAGNGYSLGKTCNVVLKVLGCSLRAN